ncbi:MAG: Glycosyltransferase Gtf1 [Anaerolineales bacterium]|nr:Glycosyltransferase Gtf1 [Anaerolineales bacterium]WKZ47760.1 MAG: glycosyltransferase family 4 protein [Anaerolineales bacterium]
MRLGIALSPSDSWHFFRPIHDDFTSRFEVDVFKPYRVNFPFFQERINRWFYRKQLDEFLKGHDVVFFEWASGLLAQATALPKSCRIVTRLHRYEFFEWSGRIAWEKVDAIILVSNTMLRMFSEKFPAHRSKCVVIPVGISTSKFYPGKRIFHGDIGVLCHISPRKRIYDLIMAFNELCGIQDGFHLHIAGGYDNAHMDYSAAIQTLIARLSLEDRITFYGNIKDPSEWYRGMDVFVTNSYAEGMQVAPMEAMASGCYCLSHYWDGAEELLPPENLYISNAELVEKILEYTRLPESLKQKQRSKMRAMACDKFGSEQIAPRIRQVVEQIG